MTGVFIWTAVLILDVLALVDVFKNVADPLKKVIWILAVFILPLIGPLAYYLMGRGGRAAGDGRLVR
jgi:hypothetical protein